MGLGPNGEGGDYPRGYGATAALAYTLAKLMVCWCSGDPLEVAKLIDLGFLMSMSVLSVAALTPALARARPLLVETALVHILLEMGVYLVALPRMGDVAPEKGLMSPAMVLHHLATVLGGVGMVTSGVHNQVFHWVSAQLILTEVTTFMPIAFQEAFQSKKMGGVRSIVIAVAFPLSFVVRTLLSLQVVVNYTRAMHFLGAKNVPLWLPTIFAGSTIFALNTVWTYRIVRGTLRALSKRQGASQ